MKQPSFKSIIIGVLVLITAFIAFKYGTSLKERFDSYVLLNQLKEQLDSLEQEKQNLLAYLEKERERGTQLTEENAQLKDNIKATRRRLTRLFMEKREKEKAHQELSYHFALLKAENSALLEEKSQLNKKMAEAASENQSLKTKLSSIQELKKAIRELRKRKRTQPQSLISLKPRSTDKMMDGNRGYILKDGKSTYLGRIHVEVRPASSAE